MCFSVYIRLVFQFQVRTVLKFHFFRGKCHGESWTRFGVEMSKGEFPDPNLDVLEDIILGSNPTDT